jgi:hypothetical protein
VIPVKSVPGIGRGEIKESYGGNELEYDIYDML